MNKLIALAVGGLLLLLLLVFSTTYTVSFHEVAIRKTFGKSSPDSVTSDPGLKFKLPLVQDKALYDTRIQILETPLDEVALTDGQQVIIKAYLLWRVDTSDPSGQGPYEFDRIYGKIDGPGGASDLLRDPFVTAVSGALSAYRFDDLVGAGNRLVEAEQQILASLGHLKKNGVLPVSVGISQVLLPERATNSVITRMEAEREKLAEAERHRGTAQAEGVTSGAATLADTIRAFAENRATEIRSEGDEIAAQYMRQMSEKEDLAIFLVWLDALDKSLAENSTFLLDVNSAPWHLMNLSTSMGGNGIPAPGGATMAGRRN